MAKISQIFLTVERSFVLKPPSPSPVLRLSKVVKPFSCFCRRLSVSPSNLERAEQFEKNKEIIARVLGLSPKEINRPPRKLVNENAALLSYKILQDYGFGRGQVLDHPEVFMMVPTAIENYLEIMTESLFNNIRLNMVLNFRNVHKQSLKVLKENDMIPSSHVDVLQSYCKVLGMTDKKTEDSLWESLPNDIDRLSLADLRKQVLVLYFKLKLDAKQDELIKSFKMYPRTEYRCMKWIRNSLELLLVVLKFPKDKIIKHSYLLHANPSNTSQVIREIPALSGIPLPKLVMSRPKILMSACSSLKEIEKLLLDHEIPSISVIKYPEVYTLSPGTIKERLEELDDIPEFRPLKRHPRVARLIYYQNKAKARIDYLKSIHLSGGSLHLLSSDTKRFKKLMSLGEMKTKGTDVINTICDYLGKDATSKSIRKSLMRQPHWLQCSLVNVEESLQFLDSFGLFSKDNICNALPILLYPKEKIEKEFENVVVSGEAKMSDDFFLHMTLYFLERAVHFSGDGLWSARNSINADDDDHEDTQEDSMHGNTILESEDVYENQENTMKIEDKSVSPK